MLEKRAGVLTGGLLGRLVCHCEAGDLLDKWGFTQVWTLVLMNHCWCLVKMDEVNDNMGNEFEYFNYALNPKCTHNIHLYL